MSNIEVRISLQRNRFHLIQQATKFDLDDHDGDRNVSQTSRQFINTRLDLLEQNWTKFEEEHEAMYYLEDVSLNNHAYMTTRTFERCQEFYIHAKAKLLTLRDEIDASIPTTRSVSSENSVPTTTVSPRLGVLPEILPEITLPRFSGNFQEWRSYHDLFSSLIRNNSELKDVEKMYYLKTTLSGEAARLVTNLPVTGESFAIAWEILFSRYENKRLLISSHLDQLTNLKPIKGKSAEDLSAFLATISEALGGLRSLGCLVEHWDPLLLHLLVKLLDMDSRMAWEMKLGSTTSYPTYAQFEDFLIGRIRVMQNLSLHPSTSSKEKARRTLETTRAKGTVNNSATCPLCTSTHYLASCPTYQSKTSLQRRDIVNEHRRCFNCLGMHAVRHCRNTKRCLKCGKRHHTTLHISQEKNIFP